MHSQYFIAGFASIAAVLSLVPTSFARPSHGHVHEHFHPRDSIPQTIAHNENMLFKPSDIARIHGHNMVPVNDKSITQTKFVTVTRTVLSDSVRTAAPVPKGRRHVKKHLGRRDAVGFQVGRSSVGLRGSTASRRPTSTAAAEQPQNTTVAQTGSIPSLAGSTTPNAAQRYAGNYPRSNFPTNYLSATSINIPEVESVQLLGNSNQDPDMQYLPELYQPSMPTLSAVQLNGMSNDVTMSYPIYNLSGTQMIPSDQVNLMKPLDFRPYMSRDGGKGGYLNGQKLFIFSDTGINDPNNQFVSFVSNSIAVDAGNNAISGKAVTLKDKSGEWYGGSGQMRGFVPMTTGEQQFNNQQEQNGQRYAIWPESSIIPLDGESALQYNPIVFTDTTRGTSYTYAGTTLVKITIPSNYGGPTAERVNKKIFNEDGIEWGCVGGIRSWPAEGPGSSGGKVYIFGNKAMGGLLLARVDAANVADASKYEYYSKAAGWTAQQPTKASTDYFLPGAFSTVDVFYSPRHLTFIAVYQTPFADNAFHWSYLKADKPIIPKWAGGDDEDIMENLVKYQWSSSALLYNTPKPPNGAFTYGGGVNALYFDEEDLQRGGGKMLLGWTAPLGTDFAPQDTGYDHVTAVVNWK